MLALAGLYGLEIRVYKPMAGGHALRCTTVAAGGSTSVARLLHTREHFDLLRSRASWREPAPPTDDAALSPVAAVADAAAAAASATSVTPFASSFSTTLSLGSSSDSSTPSTLLHSGGDLNAAAGSRSDTAPSPSSNDALSSDALHGTTAVGDCLLVTSVTLYQQAVDPVGTVEVGNSSPGPVRLLVDASRSFSPQGPVRLLVDAPRSFSIGAHRLLPRPPHGRGTWPPTAAPRHPSRSTRPTPSHWSSTHAHRESSPRRWGSEKRRGGTRDDLRVQPAPTRTQVSLFFFGAVRAAASSP
jgi:hypothetical protein